MTQEEKWLLYYKYAVLFYQKNGNLLIPTNYFEYLPDGQKLLLGSWIHNQRNAYNGIGNCTISEEKIALLNKIDMYWGKKVNTLSAKWLRNYKIAVQYFLKNGHLDLPKNYVAYTDYGHYKLGEWISDCRSLFVKNKLSKEKIDLLNNINMVWDLFEESYIRQNWIRMYNFAKDYYSINGDLLIPSTYEIKIGDNVIKLGVWLHRQRKFYNKQELSKEKIELLEKIGMVWQVNKRKVKNR